MIYSGKSTFTSKQILLGITVKVGWLDESTECPRQRQYHDRRKVSDNQLSKT